MKYSFWLPQTLPFSLQFFSFVFAFSIFMFFIIAIKNMKKKINLYFLQIHHNASKMCFYAIFMIGIYLKYASGVSEWEWVCRRERERSIRSVPFYLIFLSYFFSFQKYKTKKNWFGLVFKTSTNSSFFPNEVLTYRYIILYIYIFG